MRTPDSTDKYSNLLESSIGAASGFLKAVKTEKKIRQVFQVMVVVTIICALADVGYFQILMVVFSWVVALICEMFNTALENALDYASGKEYHPLIKQGKDYAAACTFVSIVFASWLSLFILWDSFFGEHARWKAEQSNKSSNQLQVTAIIDKP